MNRKRSILLVLAVILIAGCTTYNIVDPVAAGLFAVKEEWTAVREHIILENYAGRLSDADMEKFREKDRIFSASYNVANALRGSGGPVFDAELRSLREMLLDARRTYYPTGGK